MYNKWHGMGVEFLGISFDTDKEKWTDYIAQSGVPYPQVSELKPVCPYRPAEITTEYLLRVMR